MTAARGAGEQDEGGKGAARGLLNRAFSAYVGFAVVSGLVLAAGLILPHKQFSGASAAKLLRAAGLLKMFLVALFFGATTINLGVQWAATILAGRRYRHSDAYPAARVVATSQWICLGVYGLFEAAVLYYRLGLAGDRIAFFTAIAAAAVASYYFLRLPSFLHRRVFGKGEAQGP